MQHRDSKPFIVYKVGLESRPKKNATHESHFGTKKEKRNLFTRS